MAEATDSDSVLAAVNREPTPVGRPLGLTQDGAKEWERLGSLCPKHLGDVVVFFCLKCSQSCCTLCSLRDHHEHSLRYMDTEGESEGSFGHTGIFFPPEFTLEGLLKKLNEDLQAIDMRGKDAKTEINECVERHKVSLEKSKKELVDHVNAVKKARLKYLQEQQKHLRRNLDWLISIVLFTNQHFDSDDQFSLLLAEKEITRRVAELNEKCSKISLPSEQDWNLDKIKVIRDGKYVWANRSRKVPPPLQPGMRTVHDTTFGAASVKVGFKMEPEMLQKFVKVCCQELGEEYQLRLSQ